ncbi:ATP-grasp domain-containing protein [Streptomyces sp. NPDC056831]|uniref:ATP-grasp domain-containing protein n=1 Tax=Streptomyces sp. NPDC056831 TaxID=3345954 RepID=UPI003677B52B
MSHPTSTVLVVSPGDEVYRRYCLEQVATAYKVVVVTDSQPTWQTPFIADWEVTDLTDPDAVVAAGRELGARHDVSGVLTWDEYLLVPTARLAEHLGLPGSHPDAMRACRDKGRTRTVLAEHRVGSATSIRTTSLMEAVLAAESIGYPIVLKPASNAASIGVIRIDNGKDLAAGYAFAAAGAHGIGSESDDVLVEEYLDGPEVSVECVTHRGVTAAVAVTRKTLGFEPYFEEIAHSVDARDPLLAEVAPVATAAVAALGISTGIQHVELRLTDRGPRIIEVNARVGGDLIGRLVSLATGLDLARVAADLACGTAPDLTPTRHQAAAIRILYPDATGTLTRRAIDNRFANTTDWLEEVRWLRDPGDRAVLPPDGDLDTARIGHVLVTGPTTEVTQQRLRLAADHVTVTVDTRMDTRTASAPDA